MKYIKYKNWNIGIEKREDKELPLFILKIFTSIFGENITYSEKCDIVNCPDAGYPILITNRNPIVLCTSAASFDHWAQYIYHFSHELTHYVIRQKNINKNITISWFEETLCEAMSLYTLDYVASNWHKSPMYKINRNYASSINSYFKYIIKMKPNYGLKNCKTLDDLKVIETNSQEIRNSRIGERNYLYDLFKKEYNNINIIIDYTKYINNDYLTINFTEWAKNVSSEERSFVKKLQVIQPSVR